MRRTQKTIRAWLKTDKLHGTQAGKGGDWFIPKTELERLLGIQPSGGARSDQIEVGQIYEVWTGPLPNTYVRALSVEVISVSGRSGVNFGEIKAESSVQVVLVDTLHLGPDELAFVYMSPVEDLQLRLTEAGQADGPEGFRHFVTLGTPRNDPGSVFWIYGRNRSLEIVVINPTRYALAMSRVRFHGWLAHTEAVQKPDGPAISAVTKGWR